MIYSPPLESDGGEKDSGDTFPFDPLIILSPSGSLKMTPCTAEYWHIYWHTRVSVRDGERIWNNK